MKSEIAPEIAGPMMNPNPHEVETIDIPRASVESSVISKTIALAVPTTPGGYDIAGYIYLQLIDLSLFVVYSQVMKPQNLIKMCACTAVCIVHKAWPTKTFYW